MEKVMLAKEEAEALEAALEMNGGVKANVVAWHAVNGLWEGKRAPLNNLDLETINIALYVGYEIERTAEDIIKELYESHPVDSYSRTLIREVLSVLGIQVPGVN